MVVAMAIRVIGAFMVGLALAFIGVSMTMNFQAGLRLGETPLESQMFAWVAVAVAEANAGFPVAIAWGLQCRRWGVVVVASLVLVPFLLYSLGSALGYAAGNRGAVVGGREAITATFEAAQKEEKDLRGRLEKVATARPVTVIEKEIARHKQDRLWAVTKDCLDATATASREFCKAFEALQAELAGSAEAALLRRQLDKVVGEAAVLRTKGAGRDSDPQASTLSRLFGFSAENVQSAWSVLFATLVELGCAFVPMIGLSMLGLRHAPPLPTEAQVQRPARVRKRRGRGGARNAWRSLRGRCWSCRRCDRPSLTRTGG